MVATASDLTLVLTGGSSNISPSNSLGGDPSSTPISGVLNNLFDNITDSQATAGRVDYRCIYLFNDSSSNIFYDTKFYISDASGDVQLGWQLEYDEQRITIAGGASGGSFDISYTPPGLPPETQTVAYNADPSVWRANLETAINTISYLDANVAVGGTGSNRTFDIQFTDYRNHDLFGLDITGLTGGTITGSVSKLTGGSPINAIPPLLDAPTTAPAGVVFFSPTAGSPAIVGTLYPEEGLPIWIRRTTAAGTLAAQNVGFSLKVIISPVS